MQAKILTEKDLAARSAADIVLLDTEKLFNGRRIFLESTDGGHYDKDTLRRFQNRFGIGITIDG